MFLLVKDPARADGTLGLLGIRDPCISGRAEEPGPIAGRASKSCPTPAKVFIWENNSSGAASAGG